MCCLYHYSFYQHYTMDQRHEGGLIRNAEKQNPIAGSMRCALHRDKAVVSPQEACVLVTWAPQWPVRSWFAVRAVRVAQRSGILLFLARENGSTPTPAALGFPKLPSLNFTTVGRAWDDMGILKCFIWSLLASSSESSHTYAMVVSAQGAIFLICPIIWHTINSSWQKTK